MWIRHRPVGRADEPDWGRPSATGERLLEKTVALTVYTAEDRRTPKEAEVE